MSLFWIYIPPRGRNQAPDSSSPQKYEMRGLKTVLHCTTADKEELRGERGLLPGWAHVAGTDIGDVLRGLCCSHLLHFWMLFDPNLLSAQSRK